MRLIDADALYEKLKDAGMLFALRMVETAPTIVPKPLNDSPSADTAHWIDNADSYICSRCRYETNNPNREVLGPDVCPRCFSRMWSPRGRGQRGDG